MWKWNEFFKKSDKNNTRLIISKNQHNSIKNLEYQAAKGKKSHGPLNLELWKKFSIKFSKIY